MKELIKKRVYDSIKVKEKTLTANLNVVARIAHELITALTKGGKVILFGNGGSAADCQHVAAELIGRFQNERKSLAAIALTTDTSIITALGNDYGFDIVFSRQIEGLARPNDIVIGISTSGNSKNIIAGIAQAKKMGLKTVSLTGCGGGMLAPLSDISLVVSSNVTARVQEAHICFLHIICELVEKNFYKK